jgi:NADH oxidase (H2O2-forming)
LARKIVVVGGGAAGIGAAGGVKAADPVTRSSCTPSSRTLPTAPAASPTSTAKEIDDFQRLFLATKEAYVQAGIDIRYETRSAASTSPAR